LMIDFYFFFLVPCIWLQTTHPTSPMVLALECEWALASMEKLSSTFTPWNPLCTQSQAVWASAIISCNVFMGPREFKTCKTWVQTGWYQNPYLFWVLV
jgi:hypothetical protein